MRKLLALVALAVLPACVGPALWYDAYEGKAGATAAQMQSTVETARFVALVAGRGKTLAAYVGVALSDAEHDASAIQGAFDSIQPPSPRADRLRDQLDAVRAEAEDRFGALPTPVLTLFGVASLKIAALSVDVEEITTFRTQARIKPVPEALGHQLAAEASEAAYHATTRTLNLELPQTMGGAELAAWIERFLAAAAA